MQAGEFASVAEAARVAGLTRDPRTALKGEAPLVTQMLALWSRATQQERQVIRDYLEREDSL
jgi:hypothetical protein